MKRFCLKLLPVLVLVALTGPPQTTWAQNEAGDGQPPIAGKAKHQHGGLDSILNDVMAAYERTIVSMSKREGATTQTEAQEAAGRVAANRAPMSKGAAVAVTLRIEDVSRIEAVTRFLSDNGGDPRNVGEDYIEAYVPVALLVAASKQPGVFRVQAIIPPQPKRGPITSEGVGVHGAALWHAAGITGKGVKVGVIDLGFSGFSQLMGTELPGSVRVRCYIEMGEYTTSLEQCEANGEPHGTAVAEALVDIAPNVQIYIALVQTNGDLRNAVDWMASEGVQVINYSVGDPWDGPGDGTSPSSDSPLRTVDVAVENGIVWANAAGNEGLSAWFGPFRDADGDSYHDFAYWPSGNPMECIPLAAVPEGTDFSVQLRWQGRWRTDDLLADLDLFLHEKRSGLHNPVVAASGEFQNYVNSEYRGTKEPNEYLVHEARLGRSYCLSIKRDADHSYGVPSPSWIQLIERNGIPFADDVNFFGTPGSITNPAESANPGLLAVGATPWNGTQTIEERSSLGPTPGGRIKPDIVGVDMAQSSSYRTPNNPSGAFPGTSQASPHVAGLAALIRSAYPHYNPEQVANYLRRNAEPRGIVDPYYNQFRYWNNVWGYGLAKLPQIEFRGQLESEDGSQQFPLSQFFPNAQTSTTYAVASSNPRLVTASVRQGALVITPVPDGEGLAVIRLTATFRDGLEATVRIAVTVEGAFMQPSLLSGWRLGLFQLPSSTTVSSTKPFEDTSTEN